MSQTETILLIVLGFSLASLIALFLARGLWSAAVRVGARRMQRQVPSSLVGLQTERDRLRADYAMLSQRLGTRLEAAKLQMAEYMAEVSRHRNRLHELEALEQNRGAETRRLAARVAELEGALAQSRTEEDALRRDLALAGAELVRLQERARHTHAPHHPAPNAPHIHAAAPVDDAEARLRHRIDRLNELARAKPEDDVVIKAPPPPEDPLLAEKLAQAERETEDLTRDLEKLDAEWQQRLASANIAESEADANVISLSNRIRDLKKSLGQAS